MGSQVVSNPWSPSRGIAGPRSLGDAARVTANRPLNHVAENAAATGGVSASCLGTRGIRLGGLLVLVCSWLATSDVAVGQASAQELGSTTERVGGERLDRVQRRVPEGVGASDWGPARTEQLQGQIVSFDAEALVLNDALGKATRLASSQVQSVDIAWQRASVVDALQVFHQRRYQAAVSLLDQARKDNVPQWQQRFLIAHIIEAVEALGSTRSAGVLFLNLAASRPPDLLYADMPLCWTVREGDRPLMDAARQWLASEDVAAQLLGASWLLFSDESAAARERLLQLQSSDQAVIANLAVAQSWRLVPPPETMQQLQAWQQFRDSLLEPLQLGPSEFLADRLMRIGEHDLAIGQWLRIAAVHSQRYHRARQAMANAESLLRRLERVAEAEQLQAWIEEVDGKQ